MNSQKRERSPYIYSIWIVVLGLVGLPIKTLNSQEPPSTRSSKYTVITTFHSGICDASAIVAFDDKTFVAADDEQNRILVYEVGRPGPSLKSIDVSEFLQVDKEKPEVDLEGGTRVGDTIYWVSSHGRNRKAKKRHSRYRFFATRISKAGEKIDILPYGVAYERLVADLIDDKRYSIFGLKEASKLAPKSPGALNIEGLTKTPDGKLLVGFRNPLPQGKALIAPLINPADVVLGQKAQFAAPILLDLEGNGIRGMASTGNTYLIIAGPIGTEGRMFLHQWKGPGTQATKVGGIEFGDLNPEGVTFLPTRPPKVLLASDDGTREIDGIACKELTDFKKKQFRSVLIEPKKQKPSQ